jgi:hypothetical protein
MCRDNIPNEGCEFSRESFEFFMHDCLKDGVSSFNEKCVFKFLGGFLGEAKILRFVHITPAHPSGADDLLPIVPKK